MYQPPARAVPSLLRTSTEEQATENRRRRVAAEGRSIRARLIGGSETKMVQTELRIPDAEISEKALEIVISDFLVGLTELRRSKVWRLARVLKYIRAQSHSGGLTGAVGASWQLLLRGLHLRHSLPAHDNLLDIIRLLEDLPSQATTSQPSPIDVLPPTSAGSNTLCTDAVRGLVSIVLPVYNHADLLPEAIAGVLAQTYRHWELIVVDDGSHDAFDDAISPFLGDPRIHVWLQPHQNLPAALNNGFRYARGEFLTWTSADNVMLPQQLERLVTALEEDPGAGLVFSDYEVIDYSGAPLHVCWGTHDPPDSSTRIYRPRDVSIENFHESGANFLGASFLYRACIAAVVGGYTASALSAEDYDFWLRMHLITRFRHVDDMLYQYRVHDNTLSAQLSKSLLDTNLRTVCAADRKRRDMLLANGTLAPNGDGCWRNPTQYAREAVTVEEILYSASVRQTDAANTSACARLCLVDVPPRAVDPKRLQGFDIVVVPDAATYHWLREQVFDSTVRLLHGYPSALSIAVSHSAALCSSDRKRTTQVGDPAASSTTAEG